MQEVLKFVPQKSVVDPSFWHKLAEIKLDVDRLNDGERDIYAYYTNFECVDTFMELDYSAFSEEPKVPRNYFPGRGVLINKNTIEDFKQVNKQLLLEDHGKRILSAFKNGEALADPSWISYFVLLTFADLKKYRFYYWFAFPTPLQFKVEEFTKPQSVSKWPGEKLEKFEQICVSQTKSFFALAETGDDFGHVDLKSLSEAADTEKLYLCICDPSPFEEPGWFLKNLLFFVSKTTGLAGKWLNVVQVRKKKEEGFKSSQTFKLKVPEQSSEEELTWIGWEKNEQGSLGPKLASMAKSMDPLELAKSSINLNLKLMKWRLVPNIDIEKMSSTRCLLFGAGTLGCGVARSLLAWGFNYITFVDSGMVSFSNTVRQSLYTFEDAKSGSTKKSEAAAKRLKEINPNVIVHGFDIHIPMPNHPIGEKMAEKVKSDVEKIDDLVKNHDVIFLLTDSRESRWLPTMLGAYYSKIVINAALGFDSYLVMRHGLRRSPISVEFEEIESFKCIPGAELGCYFCNDVTAPGNSQLDRTLDQQCTVTRPAVSSISSSLAVEVLVGVLQHQNEALAPAYVSKVPGNQMPPETEDILGILPHSIRGYLHNFEQLIPATERFKQCVACSDGILNEYEARRDEFLFQVFESSSCLETISGVNEVINELYLDEDFDLPEVSDDEDM